MGRTRAAHDAARNAGSDVSGDERLLDLVPDRVIDAAGEEPAQPRDEAAAAPRNSGPEVTRRT
jgi:hypothetical protein